MAVTLRSACRPADYASIAELYNLVDPEPITADTFVDWDARFPAEGIRYQIVAVDDNGKSVGYAECIHLPWNKPGHFWVELLVDDSVHRRRIGSALLADIEGWARTQRAVHLDGEVRDHLKGSVAFAERNGFVLRRHRYESTLNLAGFDETRFAGVVEQLEAAGVQFFPLADKRDQALEWQVYNLHMQTYGDIPGVEESPREPFEDWRKNVIASRDARLDCSFIAVSNNQLVGITIMQDLRNTGALYTTFTGVAREFRGRGLALALKLMAINAVKREGAPYVRTNNDSENAPMLAVNRKLGYMPTPGLYYMVKSL